MRNLLYILTAAVLLSSCERLFMDETPEATPKEIFEQAWTFADQEYSFFDFKDIDWNKAYADFEPRISNDMTDEELFSEIGDMLYLLRDGHVNLKSSFNRSRNWTWYLDAPDNFDKYVLERNYFKEEQQIVGPFVVYDFDDVGFMSYRSFSAGFSEDNLDYIINQFKDKKGIIIDIRDNFGGALNNVYRIGQRFVSESTAVAKRRDKNGPGHEDFTEFVDMTFEYNADQVHFTKPIVILTNRKSYSAGNFFPTLMSALDHVTIMGDVTGGGGGAPSFTELSNGWSLRVSTTQLYTIDGVNTEDGLEPDVKVDITAEDQAAGIDTILEEALKLLRQ